MTLHLTAQLELALVSEAARRGITPEALAAELITAQLPSMTEQAPPEPEAPHAAEEFLPGTMYDRWKAHLESLPKPPPDAPPTNYSQDTGRKFAEAMVEKRRQGRL